MNTYYMIRHTYTGRYLVKVTPYVTLKDSNDKIIGQEVDQPDLRTFEELKKDRNLRVTIDIIGGYEQCIVDGRELYETIEDVENALKLYSEVEEIL